MALCGLKCLDLTKEGNKILDVHRSYNKKLQDDKNFCTAVKNICHVIKLWCMRHFSLEGKITTFKQHVMSEIVHLALVTIIPQNIIKELNEIQKLFLLSREM